MDWIACKRVTVEYLKKYRYILIILLAGVLLMLLPAGQEKEESVQPLPAVQTATLQETLETILGKISGAGKVSVLLTQSVSEETVYQINENSSSEGSDRNFRRETVMVSGSDRAEHGLVRQTKAPVYRGAVVVCEGAQSAAVRLAIVEAVKSATGLSADRISVLKMK